MERSLAAKHLWYQLGDDLWSALQNGASWDEVAKALRDRLAQIEAHRARGDEPRDFRRDR